MIDQFYAVVFGAIQGVLEWLPISSQGNLVIFMVGMFGLNPQDAVNLAIFLHTGTLLSAIVYFRRELRGIFGNLKSYRPRFDNDYNRLVSFLLIATLFTGLVGFPLYRTITEVSSFGGEVFLAIVGIALIVTGLIQKFSEKKLSLYRHLNLKDSVLLGILQGIAVIPGISRSGITVSGLLLRNYPSRKALRYSFLMSIPAILIAQIGLGLMDGLPQIAWEQALLGVMSAFFVGLLSIHLLLKIAERIKFWKFCVIIGLLTLVPLIFYL